MHVFVKQSVHGSGTKNVPPQSFWPDIFPSYCCFSLFPYFLCVWLCSCDSHQHFVQFFCFNYAGNSDWLSQVNFLMAGFFFFYSRLFWPPGVDCLPVTLETVANIHLLKFSKTQRSIGCFFILSGCLFLVSLVFTLDIIPCFLCDTFRKRRIWLTDRETIDFKTTWNRRPFDCALNVFARCQLGLWDFQLHFSRANWKEIRGSYFINIILLLILNRTSSFSTIPTHYQVEWDFWQRHQVLSLLFICPIANSIHIALSK